MLRFIHAIALFCLMSISASAVAENNRPTLDDFLEGSTFWRPELSPSGNYLAGVSRTDDGTVLVIADLNSEDGLNLTGTRMGDAFLNWIEWVTDDRLLVSITVYVNLENGDMMSREDLESNKGYPAPVTRLIAMNRDASNQIALLADSRQMNKNFYLGGVTDFLVDDPDHILMSARRGGDLDLFKVNVMDGNFERIAIGTDYTFSWYVDREGEPAFRFDSNSRGTTVYIYAREDRENGKIKWRKTKTIRKKKGKDDSATEFDPLFVGPTETTYYVAARPDGANTTGIYLYDFEKDEFLETLKTHPTVDIENALFNRSTREIQGYYYYDDKLEIEFLDPDIQKHLEGLEKYFGDQITTVPLHSNREGLRWLVYSVGPLDRGAYHVYDLETAEAREVAASSSHFRGKALAPTEVIHYEARDGLKLRGYLTRPSDLPDGAKPPLVVLPHGGPEARDVFSFNFEAQLLAAHGYQVFQPNFRGSSGFGKPFADKGRRQWGKAMQTDIEDGFRHLVSEGVADDDKACIFGTSYGGYAALAAATLTPDLYQCVISVAGISDLEAFLKYWRKEEGSKSETFKYWTEHIGDVKADKNAIRSVSPAFLADRIKAPLMLIHGSDDYIVPIKQSEIMKKAMEKAGKPLRYIELENSSHSYRGKNDDRIEYEAVLEFLEMHLPVEDSPPSERLEQAPAEAPADAMVTAAE